LQTLFFGTPKLSKKEQPTNATVHPRLGDLEVASEATTKRQKLENALDNLGCGSNAMTHP
jgi:hypothetical protein